ncbi:hypothetical protein [Devosia sp.]|uniref:hypothetical protein n=1 Tax=Devosia sp. TaxID=1871048 RepID=UPI002736DDA4|nr:hypothetical protein [Devosia sp.]MDP2780507.1 hypothetical protein [Devosia sp.]
MTDDSEVPSGADLEVIKIAVNSLYLSLGFLLKYIEETNDKDVAIAARNALLENLKNGNIDFAIMEDRKTYDFVVSVVERLEIPET